MLAPNSLASATWTPCNYLASGRDLNLVATQS